MSDLYRLVYASSNLLQDESGIPASVKQILETSQRNNAKVGVTGALMFNGGAFAQVLEGPRLGVESTFERIQRDERHGDVTVLQCGPVEARSFANWSMAFVGRSARGLAMWSRLAAESGFDISRMDGDTVFAMLHDLVLEEEGTKDAASALAGGMTASLPSAPAERSEGPQPACHATAANAPVGLTPDARDATSAPPAFQGDPTKKAREAPDSGTEAIIAVVRMALADERRRTAKIQAEADELRAALAVERDRLAEMRRERDLWAKRAGMLASALAREAAEAAEALRPKETAKPSDGQQDPILSGSMRKSAA